MKINQLAPNKHRSDGRMKRVVRQFRQDPFGEPAIAGWDPKATAKRRAKNKVARKSRRVNR